MLDYEPIKGYNWQQPDWPHFRYDLSSINETLSAIAEKAGLVNGKLMHLNKNQQTEAQISLMIEEAVKTSQIEGEFISRPDVRSSIKNRLGLSQKPEKIHDKRAQAVVEMMFDVRNTFKQPISEDKLFEWHLMLLSSSINPNLRVGYWRTHNEPMQIISGSYARETIHFEAPPSIQVPKEMKQFIRWFNRTAPGGPEAIKYAPIRAAIAHLYFESIHLFEDGNGRIGRAIAEKALSQGFGCPAILSLSQAIESEKKEYYGALKFASRSNEITRWIHYFVKIILKAQVEVEGQLNFILKKSAFFDKFKDELNERQLKVVKRMLRAGIKGFEGGMSAKKYMIITGTSKATATRDLQHLLAIRALSQIGSGRSVRYDLVI